MLLPLLAAGPGPPIGSANGPSVQAPADTVPLRIDGGRFSVLAAPRDARLGRALLAAAVQDDTFPGLPRPTAHVVIAVAPDATHFASWTGPAAPEWGAAVAFPDRQRIVVQGGRAGSSAGDPVVTLRHELAHLALHEFLGDQVPRWFDEGYASYAAHEQMRDEILATNVALALRGVPTFASLDSGLVGREEDALVSYALAHRAVSDLAALDPAHGLSLFFTYWRAGGSLDLSVRRAYGQPLDRFEAQWRSRTRRRYGALAVASDLAFATLVFLVLLAPLYVARRRRDRARLEALRIAERAAEASAAEALPGSAEGGPPRRGTGGALA